MGQQPSSAPHKSPSDGASMTNIVSIVSIVSGLAGIVGLFLTAKVGQLMWAALFIVAIGTICAAGYCMWSKRWKAASIALSALVLLLILSLIWMAGLVYGSGNRPASAADNAPAPSSTSSPGINSPAATSPAQAAANTGKFLETNTVIPRNASVDVDKNPIVIAADQQGLAGNDYDLYHYWANVASDTLVAINAPNAFTVSSGNAEQLHINCRQAVKTNSVYDSGRVFCFKTSEGRLGYIGVTDDNRNDHSFAVHLIVWNN